MIIWWLFALLWLFVKLKYYISMFTLQKCERKRLTRLRIRKAMLPHNTGGQACTFSEDSLRFACFIAASAPHARPRWTHHTQLSPWFTCSARESGWSWTGERGIEYVIKRSRASWLARARTLASALVSSRALVHLHARVSMCESVSLADEHSLSIMERSRTDAALVTSLEINE